MLRVCASAATTFLLTLSSVTSALGHPHMWVDLESRVVLNIDDGNVAIQQVWLFDDFFSTSVIEMLALILMEQVSAFKKKLKELQRHLNHTTTTLR